MNLDELVARTRAAGALGTGPETAAAALEERIRWLGRAWPNSSRLERLAAALDDLPQHQRDRLFVEATENEEELPCAP